MLHCVIFHQFPFGMRDITRANIQWRRNVALEVVPQFMWTVL